MYDALDPDLFTEPVDPGDPASADLRRDRRGLVRPPGRDPRLPRGAVQPLPVLDRRRHRRRLRQPPVRPGDPDPPGLLQVLLHQPAQRRLGGRPRARPPVVRRQRGPGRVEAHLAERGLRPVLGVDVERGGGPGHGPGAVRRLLQRDPGRRPVLERGHRRPRPAAPVRQRRVHPGGHGRPRSCGWRSATGTSSASCGPGRPARPAATAPSPSSSGWPSGSRASSSTSCSGCGCSPAASRRWRGPRRRQSTAAARSSAGAELERMRR